jgi:DNA replication protein DnaC
VLDRFSPRPEGVNETARARLDKLKRVRVLMLDDLGKAASSERADEQLENLIEKRGGECLPILWSANGSSAWLASRFGPDRGMPLVKRLAEFSTVVKA